MIPLDCKNFVDSFFFLSTSRPGTVRRRAPSLALEANNSQNTDTVEPEMEEVSTKPNNNASGANTVSNADKTGNNGTDADFNAKNCVEENM